MKRPAAASSRGSLRERAGSEADETPDGRRSRIGRCCGRGPGSRVARGSAARLPAAAFTDAGGGPARHAEGAAPAVPAARARPAAGWRCSTMVRLGARGRVAPARGRSACRPGSRCRRSRRWQPAEVFAVRFDRPPVPFPVAGMSDIMPYPSTRFSTFTPEMTAGYLRRLRGRARGRHPRFPCPTSSSPTTSGC
ncbi:MAG: hypothetical protein MZV70_55620 [Desulfobacterales bacterium]|nr:hypothetical protein [Desulfobacterales bacterium]